MAGLLTPAAGQPQLNSSVRSSGTFQSGQVLLSELRDREKMKALHSFCSEEGPASLAQ